MLPDELLTQPPHEAPFDPKDTFIAPSLLRVCCACGLVQDEAGATPGLERWISQQAYREAHGVSPAKLTLTHTYCQTCFAEVQEIVRQFFPKA
jgi:hypothetical protein